ncbi:hypothetical protein D3C73_657040 [compost metagenome]
MEKEKLINIRSSSRHCVFEFLIKQQDVSQDKSRSAVFERMVKAAEGVTDWNLITPLLSPSKLVIEEAPMFTNFQAKYSEATEKILKKVRDQMFDNLKETGVKVLQSQYLVLLLQANYLECLQREKLSIKQIKPDNVDIPEMARIFCQMMLIDKDCDELQQIREILIKWRTRK